MDESAPVVPLPPSDSVDPMADMFANLQAAYAELTHAQFDLERRHNESNELLDLMERVVESMSDALFVLDGAGRVVRVNLAATRILGSDRETLTGRFFSELTGIEAVASTPKALLEQSEDGTVTNVEAAIATKGGELVTVSASSGLIRDRRGKITGVLVIARDVTEIKKAQDAERELIQMKEDFVASVSHELRTPLASIKGFVDLVLKGKVADPDVRKEFLTRVIQESDRLMALVNDLLDVSRMESGRFELDFHDADVEEVIRETLLTLETLAAQKQVELSFVAPSSPIRWRADWARIRQVIVNLVGNAIKFTESARGIAIVAEAAEGLLTVRVKDDGPGIPKEALGQLFDKFYQVGGSVQRAAKGTGLGLYLSRLIVEAHGGRIWAESELGHGSTFIVTMPRVEAGGHEARPLPKL